MNKYPYTHFEIMTQLEDAINKLEANSKVFAERLEKLETGLTINDFYQAEKQKINQIVNRLDTITTDLGAVDWIQ